MHNIDGKRFRDLYDAVNPPLSSRFDVAKKVFGLKADYQAKVNQVTLEGIG